jgi:hypothetical protein
MKGLSFRTRYLLYRRQRGHLSRERPIGFRVFDNKRLGNDLRRVSSYAVLML